MSEDIALEILQRAFADDAGGTAATKSPRKIVESLYVSTRPNSIYNPLLDRLVNSGEFVVGGEWHEPTATSGIASHSGRKRSRSRHSATLPIHQMTPVITEVLLESASIFLPAHHCRSLHRKWK
jgi:hypothetical protein